MQTFSRGACSKIASVSIAATLTFFAAVAVRAASPAPSHRPGEVLVLFRGSNAPVRFNFGSDEEAAAAIAAYRHNPAVERAARNSLVRLVSELRKPNDEFFSKQWHLEKIRAPEAWSVTQGSRTVTVAVLDTGVDINHPDLRDNIWTNPREVLDGLDNDGNGFRDDVHGWNFVDDVGDPQPNFRGEWTETGIHHGTMVAGLIGAVGNNSIGVAGVAWYVRIMPVRVLSSAGVGDVATVVQGIDYAVKNGAQILNLSFVGVESNDILDAAIRRAHDAGLVIVAAAGNDSAHGGLNLDANPQYPVCSDGGPGNNYVIGVTATDEADRKAMFSGYGTHCVDLAAPGTAIYSTRYRGGGQLGFDVGYGGYWQGSSLATPLVAGAAALLKSLNPALGTDQIRETLMTTADPIEAQNQSFVGKLGAGRLNLAAAVVKVAQSFPSSAASRAYLGVAAPPGSPPEIRLFARNGGLVRSFLAWPATFTGGINAAAGDLDGDGHEEIVVAPLGGEAPRVKIFDSAGVKRGEFVAYDYSFRGGMNVAVGDVDGDGKAEIITAARAGGGPHVRVFDGDGRLLASFFAYAPTFRGGVNLAVGDLYGEGRAAIITAPGPGGGPHLRVFDGRGFLRNEFFVGDKSDRRGLRIAAGDTQAQGTAGIAVAAASGEGNTLYLINSFGVLYGLVEVSVSTTAQNLPFALGDVDGSGRAYLLVSVPTAPGMSLSVYDTDGKERAYTLTYTKRNMPPPIPFVVRKP